MLRIALPKGSLERATLELFEHADLPITRSSDVNYRGEIADPRVSEVRILRPQEIPTYVAEGLFDMGITGRDWVEETSSDVISLGELKYSKNTSRPVNVVVAVQNESKWKSISDFPSGVRVSTEYPNLTKRFFEKMGVKADIRLSYGATEAKVPDIVDCVVDLTETGRALRAAGLRVVDTILTSYTELIANPDSCSDQQKNRAMEQLKILLWGVLESRGKVLVKMNVPTEQLDDVIKLLPSMKMPTVNELFKGGGYAVETVALKSEINTLIPELKDAGASDIIEVPLAKIVY